MKLVNLTTHDIKLWGDGGKAKLIILPSGTVARLETRRFKTCMEVVSDGVTIAVWRTEYGLITGLPEPQADTLYIVSALVREWARRDDVVSVGGFIRDDKGCIIGVDCLEVG